MKAKKVVPKPSLLLARALRLLGSNGEFWIKGNEKVEKGTSVITGNSKAVKRLKDNAYCAIGACFEINTPNEKRAIRLLAKAIDPDCYSSVYDLTITAFNDRKETTFLDIKAAFKRAIKAAKAKGK